LTKFEGTIMASDFFNDESKKTLKAIFDFVENVFEYVLKQIS